MSTLNLNDNQGPALRTLLIVVIIIPTLVIILRFWSRAILPAVTKSRSPVRFWWDDWAALVAACLNLAYCGIGIRLIQLGIGRHVEVVPPENITPLLMLVWVQNWILNTGTAAARASALFLYARIFSHTNSRFKYALWTTHALNVACCIGNTIAAAFECLPVEKAWMPELPGTCLNRRALWLIDFTLMLVVDGLILALPLPKLWRLQMKPIRKLLVFCLFVCGYFFLAVSIGVVVSVLQTGQSLQDDPTWYIGLPGFWISSDITCALIDISLPNIFFLLRYAYNEGSQSLLSTRRSSCNSKPKPIDRNPNCLVGIRAGPYNGAAELTMCSSDSLRNEPFKEAVSNYHIATIRASPSGLWQQEDIKQAGNTGIHVRSDFAVS